MRYLFFLILLLPTCINYSFRKNLGESYRRPIRSSRRVRRTLPLNSFESRRNDPVKTPRSMRIAEGGFTLAAVHHAIPGFSLARLGQRSPSMHLEFLRRLLELSRPISPRLLRSAGGLASPRARGPGFECFFMRGERGNRVQTIRPRAVFHGIPGSPSRIRWLFGIVFRRGGLTAARFNRRMRFNSLTV
jgi:hypothetical protein